MSSDADYASFLNKANQETGASKTLSNSNSASTNKSDADVPQVLQEVEQYYVSEADEPFEPVSLKWDSKTLPTEDEFANLVTHRGQVSIISSEEFDPQGQYKNIISAVETAGGSEVKVYRLQINNTRAEYYVVGIDLKASKIVGLKAKAVES